MILLPQYEDKKIAVMGLGVSGRATVASLSASGAEVYAWDEGDENLKRCQEEYRDVIYSPFQKWPWKAIETLVLSPGIPLNFPKPHTIVDIATVYGCEIIGDVELLMRTQSDATYVGITGTNGKSTTTVLTGHLLKSVGANVQVGGNIGKAALDLEPLGKDGIYVLEMSSYQIDLMLHSTFDVAALLNISLDHLERHGGMEGYIAAKRRIFDGMGVKDMAIISQDDEYCRFIAKELKGGKNLYAWQDSKPKIVEVSVNDECPIKLDKIPTLQGEHNKQNALFAIAICEALGYKAAKLQKAFKSFAGLVHRMQPVMKQEGVIFVNDSKATNAEAVSHALNTYDEIYWIAGGVAKEGGIESLAEYFPKIKKAYLIGQAANDFAKTLRASKVKYEKSATLEKAVAKASKEALKHQSGVVLLSPAAASFDQFKNFEERGEHFTAQLDKIFEVKTSKAIAKDDAA